MGSAVAFTKLYEGWIPQLVSADVSGREMAVLAYLLQWQNNLPIVSRPVHLISEKTGISEGYVRKCLSRLCNDRVLPNGEPVLSSYVGAGRGQCAVYYCNLPHPDEMGSSDGQAKTPCSL